MQLKLPSTILVRPQTVKRLRELLENHLGPQSWTETDIEQMASDIFHLVHIVASIRLRVLHQAQGVATESNSYEHQQPAFGDVPPQIDGAEGPPGLVITGPTA